VVISSAGLAIFISLIQRQGMKAAARLVWDIINPEVPMPRLSPPPVIKGTMLPLTVALGGPDLPRLTVTRLTHACVLIQWGDEAILTDPWFSQKPLYHHGESLPFGVGDLPDLTAVLSSMDHYDHCDIASFAAYRDKSVPFLAIKGSKQGEAARAAGFSDVRDVGGWTSVTIGSATFHAIPANGFAPGSFRYEQAYVIEAAGRRILFCAHHLKGGPLARVKERFAGFDLALLGVNGLRIKPLLGRKMSMDPEDAATICAELSVKVAVPVHYAFNGGWFSSTFLLSHKGTPQQFTESVRRVAPGTTPITLCPGQELRLTAG
jgi:L-ascorbate metabolism protein UlaG (beta-lactamase superfamily)